MHKTEGPLAHIGTLDDIARVLEFVREFCVEQGCLRTSYHFTPVFDHPTSVRTVVHAYGFSNEWLERYEQSDFRANDPIPERTLRHGKLLSWHDALHLEPMNDGQLRYMLAMKEFGLEHGFGLPVYGPNGRDAYSSFDWGLPVTDLPENVLPRISAVAVTGHLRVCELLEAERAYPTLSEREREVLELIAHGKSNTDIGTILQISSETVRTYTGRIFDKLGARDRVSAAIKGLKRGLFRL